MSCVAATGWLCWRGYPPSKAAREVHRRLNPLSAVPDKAAGMGHTPASLGLHLSVNHAPLERTYCVVCSSTGNPHLRFQDSPSVARHHSVTLTEW